ncbi:unnamed protein product [Adineta ricciae]|uniref:VWFA domain-containing protein n=1 Tax=Adineta ricciae TaxID=249248 RepID=A0A815H1S4_ADIRI|nr:unnamed protein product [Adineta ricciae]
MIECRSTSIIVLASVSDWSRFLLEVSLHTPQDTASSNQVAPVGRDSRAINRESSGSPLDESQQTAIPTKKFKKNVDLNDPCPEGQKASKWKYPNWTLKTVYFNDNNQSPMSLSCEKLGILIWRASNQPVDLKMSLNTNGKMYRYQFIENGSKTVTLVKAIRKSDRIINFTVCRSSCAEVNDEQSQISSDNKNLSGTNRKGILLVTDYARSELNTLGVDNFSIQMELINVTDNIDFPGSSHAGSIKLSPLNFIGDYRPNTIGQTPAEILNEQTSTLSDIATLRRQLDAIERIEKQNTHESSRLDEIKKQCDVLQKESIERLSSISQKQINAQEQLQFVLKRTKEINQMMKALQESESVDVCFLMDCTNSMQKFIIEVKDRIFETIRLLKSRFSHLNIRLAFVGY